MHVVIATLLTLSAWGSPDGPVVTMEAAPVLSQVAPGGTMPVAVRFTIPEAWHIYWKDAGTAGVATELRVKAPPNVKIGPVRYSRPMSIDDPAGVVLGYERTALLVFNAKVDPTTTADEWVELTVEASWMVCKKACYLGSRRVHVRFAVNQATASPGPGKAWLEAASIPKPLTATQAKVTLRPGVLELQLGSGIPAPAFIPFHVPGVEVQPARFDQQEGRTIMRIPYRLSHRDAMGHAPVLSGLLTQGTSVKDSCWWVDIPLPSPVETGGSALTNDAQGEPEP